MNKKEAILQRQMELFEFIKEHSKYGFRMSNTGILEKMSHIYNTVKTIERDLGVLEQKFLINRNNTYISPTNSYRIIKITNRSKELLSQCNYDYIEALALANPHCFKIKWRDGYSYREGGVRKFLDEKNAKTHIGRQWSDTGVWLLSQPSKLLSKRPIKHDQEEINDPDNKSYLDNRPAAF